MTVPELAASVAHDLHELSVKARALAEEAAKAGRRDDSWHELGRAEAFSESALHVLTAAKGA